MTDKAKAVLTNIKPREVSLVDTPANEKEFIVVKNKAGAKAENKEATPEPNTKPVLKKLEVAVHTINFFKSQYKTIEDCKKALLAQGINPEGLEVQDLGGEYGEYRFIINPEAVFEGTSLWSSYFIPMGKGVDGQVAVLKNLGEQVEKVGAKISGNRMKVLKEVFDKLETIIKEVEGENKEGNVKENEVKKNEEAAPNPEQKAAPAADESKSAPAASEGGAAEPQKAAPQAEGQETEVMKKLASIEKQFNEYKTTKDGEIAELKKKLADLEVTPSAPKGEGAGKGNGTEEPVQKKKSLWSGVL